MVQTDYRTNIHHTLKKNPLKLSDLQEFITCYNSSNRHKRVETYHRQSIILKAGGGSLVMMRLLPVIKHL